MARNELTIFRKDGGGPVAADTAVLPFNPEWVSRRSGNGFYGIREFSGSNIPLLARQTTQYIEFEFSGQRLSATNRAILEEFVVGQLPVADGGQGWLNTIWLRDEVYGLPNGQQTRNLRLPHGSSFIDGTKTRWFYEMPIVLTAVDIDSNPRTAASGIQYWEGSFTCTELPGVS